jgi:hypothetical protein
MKLSLQNTLIASISLFILSSCNQDRKDLGTTESTIVNVPAEDKPINIADIPYYAELDSNSQSFSIIKSDLVKTDDLSEINICNALNRKYPEISIDNATLSRDTVLVTIPNATYLTQQSGTMGAKIYMMESTYSFTELPNVKFVKFIFREGDHASPGVFTRKDFNFEDVPKL